MTNARGIYCSIVRQRYDSLAHPFWQNDPIPRLGDYGKWKSHCEFVRKGNLLADLERKPIAFENKISIGLPQSISRNELLAYGCEYAVSAAGAANQETDVSVTFTGKQSLLLHANQLEQFELQPDYELRNLLVQLWQNNDWDRDNVIVTSRITVQSLHSYIYEGQEGTLSFRAQVPVATFDIRSNFDKLTVSGKAGIKTELWHEHTATGELPFIIYTKRLVRPIVDLAGDPQLEYRDRDQGTGDEPLNTQTVEATSDDWILGDV